MNSEISSAELQPGQLFIKCPEHGIQPLTNFTPIHYGDVETVEGIKQLNPKLLVDGKYMLAECATCNTSLTVKKAE